MCEMCEMCEMCCLVHFQIKASSTCELTTIDVQYSLQWHAMARQLARDGTPMARDGTPMARDGTRYYSDGTLARMAHMSRDLANSVYY